jgi:hypothetical protein
MNEPFATSAPNPPMSVGSPDERLADLRRRRAEAADVLAETLLDMWLRERRAQRAAASGSMRAGNRRG